MELAAGLRWRKAMVISLLVHSIVLTGAGWLVNKALLPVEMPPETLIELELANGPEGPEGPTGSSLAAAAPTAAPTSPASASPAPVPNLPQPTLVQPAPVAESVMPEPVVAVSAMALVGVDSGAIAAASESAGGDGGGGTSTGGGGGSSQGGQGSGGGNGMSGGGSGSAGGVIPPGILSRREPNYPEQARQGGVEGTVVLRIEILENGHAGEVSIAESSGSELLDDAAVDAVQRWRFVPAKVRGTGQRIACQTTMPVVFKLRA